MPSCYRPFRFCAPRGTIVGIPARHFLLTLALALGIAAPAAAERLCDAAFEDCRSPLIDLIRNERTGIDVAFWFMEDARYSAELVRKAQEGVPVRVLMDTRANTSYPLNAQILEQLRTGGIPMRRRTAGGILHMKVMLFAGQQTVEFSGANYSPNGFTPVAPYLDYVDEAIYFSDDPAVVRSFMRQYDDLWQNTTAYEDYANVTSHARRYPQYSIDASLNFPPAQSFRRRAVAAYNAETAGIDAIVYRITDRAHADAMIAAVARGVPVRIITEQEQYRDPVRLWHSWNVDRMYMAGVQIRHRAHQGLVHQKSTILRGQGLTIFGSSNWTSPSSDSQQEHNYFTTKAWFRQWFIDQFERKWNNLVAGETQPFRPLPPDEPLARSPASGATNVGVQADLVFNGGPFAHMYDIYFGTTPDPPLLEANVALGPTAPGGSPRRYELPDLAPNTTYYWRVVGRTLALQERSSLVFSFSTGTGQTPAPPPTNPAAPQPALTIDLPHNGEVLRQPFAVAGWAVDAASRSGSGIDVVHVYAYPASGSAPIFLGAASTTYARPDIAAIFGTAFLDAGYGLLVRGLAPGVYTIVVYGHSTVSGTFVIAKTVQAQIVTSAAITLDAPANGSTVGRQMLIGGWALDFGARSGNGVDIVHVYAYPLDTGGAPIFIAQVPVNVTRPDVGAAFGLQFAQSGYNVYSSPLAPGRYRIVAFARSLVAGTFSASASADVIVR